MYVVDGNDGHRDRIRTQKTFPLPAADGVTIDKKTSVILVRFQGKVMAFNLACPHENTALRWKPAVGRFECTKHDSKYSPDGTYIGGRATRNMDRLEDHARRRHRGGRSVEADQVRRAGGGVEGGGDRGLTGRSFGFSDEERSTAYAFRL